MRTVQLDHETDFDGWRRAARDLRGAGAEPGAVAFRVGPGAQGLFDDALPATSAPTAAFPVSRAFIDLARDVVLHRSADRFDLLYRLLWRLGGAPHLLKVVTDPDVADALDRARNVSRAAHKMKAFVRFRRVEDGEGEGDAWAAWFEPAHRVLDKTAPFFMRRFTTMRWAIFTPDGSVAWDGASLLNGPPATRDMAPAHDDMEDFWRTYYASTFNPARLRVSAMQSEMPRRYWRNLPEAELIPGLIADARGRTDAMVDAPAPVPNSRFDGAVAPRLTDALDDGIVAADLPALAGGVQGCRRCPLWRGATRGVAGEGPADAGLMIVGEQPGDHEDLAGRPFVGPAGKVLDAALDDAGIDRSAVFITNAVKHFKHEPRGKRRLHKTPSAGEVSACRWWLDQERAFVKPRVIVAMGATAALGVLGRKVAVTSERGRPLQAPDGTLVVITVHPSYLLRLPDADARDRERATFVRDLQAAAALL